MIAIEGKNKIKKIISRSFLLLAIFVLLVFNLNRNVNAGDDIDDYKDKKEKYEEILIIKEKTRNALSNQLQLTEAEKQNNVVKFRATEKELATIFEQIDDLSKQMEEKEKDIAGKKKILANLVRTYYDEGNNVLLELLRVSKGLKKFFSQTDNLNQSIFSVSELLDEIREAKKDLEEDKEKLEGKKTESEELKDDLKKRGYYLQSVADQKQSQINQTQKDIDRYQEKLAKVESEIYSLEAGKTYADLGDLDDFSFPAKPTRITQYYGYTSFASSSSFYKNKFNNGVDFSGKSSDGYARAVADGKVLATGKCYKSGEWYAYGRWVAIKHEGEDADYVTFYAHLDSDSVSKGDKVDQGEKIGKIGNTGNSTAPHLHFSLFTISSFKVVESSTVDGLYYPTGTSANPMAYF